MRFTQDQVREVLKHADEDNTKRLGDEVPIPEIGKPDKPWPVWRMRVRNFHQGIAARRSGAPWADDVQPFHIVDWRDGWIAQQMEYLRWVHRDDDSCPTCFGEPVEVEGPLIPGRLELSQWTCEDGHCWHRCPTHGVKVAGEYDSDEQPACTCGATEKEGES